MDEIIEINIGFNETYTVKVNNYKKPKQEEKDVEKESEVTIIGKKEEPLPNTGF